MPLTEVTSLVVVSSIDITYNSKISIIIVLAKYPTDLLLQPAVLQLQAPDPVDVGCKSVVQVSQLLLLLSPRYLGWRERRRSTWAGS